MSSLKGEWLHSSDAGDHLVAPSTPLLSCFLPIPLPKHSGSQQTGSQSRAYSKSQNVKQKDCLVQVLITDDEMVPPKGNSSRKMDTWLNVSKGVKKTVPDFEFHHFQYAKPPMPSPNAMLGLSFSRFDLNPQPCIYFELF